MDRVTDYYGQIPRETDLLLTNQNMMVATAKLSSTVLGTATIVDGFTLTPTTPASLNVILTAGSIYQLENLEESVWSSLPADLAHTILKQGIQLDPVTFGVTPPATFGFSQVFLIQIQYQDLDTGATVLPYYNASNPTQPFAGPGNSGTAQNTVRKGAVASQIKAGIAAPTGTQVAPAADAGWTGLFTVTVANGAASISSGNIALLPSAPFIPVKLPGVPSAVQSGKWLFGTDTGTPDALIVSLNPAPTQLVPGMTVRVKKINAANTGPVTIDIGLGANSVTRANGAALAGGDLPANTVAEFVWDGSKWQYANFQAATTSSVTNNYNSVNLPFCVDSSVSANQITATFSPAITTISAGDSLRVKLANAVTGATTIDVNALAPIAVVRPDGSPLQRGDAAANEILLLEYDGTKLQLISAPMSRASQMQALLASVPSVSAQSISNTVLTLVTCLTVQSLNTLIDSTFDGATLTVGPRDAGMWHFDFLMTFGNLSPGLAEYVSATRTRGGATITFLSGYTSGTADGSSLVDLTASACGVVDLQAGDTVKFYTGVWATGGPYAIQQPAAGGIANLQARKLSN